MDDYLIVVDDVEEPQAGPSSAANGEHRSSRPPQRTRPLRAAAEHAMATTLRLRDSVEPLERTTRSSNAKFKPHPKLKLKLGERTCRASPWNVVSGLYYGCHQGEDCEKLRKMIQAREISNDVWFNFKDSRRGVFHIGHNLYSFKLVDLPCIIESQKTLDNKQMFKVADICQMLVIEKRIQEEEAVIANRNVNVDEFIWPHGITPPLHHARKRRFRKRVNRRTIESVEEEVERLIAADSLATDVKYEVLENVNPDLSDSEFIERDEAVDALTPGILESEVGDAPTPGADVGDGDGDEPEGEGDFDAELAAELDLALGDEEGGDEEDEDEEDEEDESDEEDEDDEDIQERKLLNEEIRDLEAAVAKKQHEIASSANPLVKKRFEDALKKLSADLEMKQAQRDEMKERQRRMKEGMTGGDPDIDAEAIAQDVADVDAQDGDLLEPDDATTMDIG
ncbi:TAFII55 protein conserved region-domain-containing protein [Pisolithus croceorrhizus]|nr:TAFII55 protein conserved region-domain-containing protein [Pisolithus croceorrhizus]